jgi:hypothetical protein
LGERLGAKKEKEKKKVITRHERESALGTIQCKINSLNVQIVTYEVKIFKALLSSKN